MFEYKPRFQVCSARSSAKLYVQLCCHPGTSVGLDTCYPANNAGQQSFAEEEKTKINQITAK
jgi:hypothetical protein